MINKNNNNTRIHTRTHNTSPARRNKQMRRMTNKKIYIYGIRFRLHFSLGRLLDLTNENKTTWRRWNKGWRESNALSHSHALTLAHALIVERIYSQCVCQSFNYRINKMRCRVERWTIRINKRLNGNQSNVRFVYFISFYFIRSSNLWAHRLNRTINKCKQRTISDAIALISVSLPIPVRVAFLSGARCWRLRCD